MHIIQVIVYIYIFMYHLGFAQQLRLAILFRQFKILKYIDLFSMHT